MTLADLDLHDLFQRMGRIRDSFKAVDDLRAFVDAVKNEVPIIRQIDQQLSVLDMLKESPDKDREMERAFDHLLIMLALREIEQEPILRTERRERAAMN